MQPLSPSHCAFGNVYGSRPILVSNQEEIGHLCPRVLCQRGDLLWTPLTPHSHPPVSGGAGGGPYFPQGRPPSSVKLILEKNRAPLPPPESSGSPAAIPSASPQSLRLTPGSPQPRDRGARQDPAPRPVTTGPGDLHSPFQRPGNRSGTQAPPAARGTRLYSPGGPEPRGTVRPSPPPGPLTHHAGPPSSSVLPHATPLRQGNSQSGGAPAATRRQPWAGRAGRCPLTIGRPPLGPRPPVGARDPAAASHHGHVRRGGLQREGWADAFIPIGQQKEATRR